MFISFEGIDGCGKGTQISYFEKYLDSIGKTYIVVREPGGTEIGETIREVLLHSKFAITGKAELLLFLASRAQLVHEKILPALKEGKVVIADRFIDSSVAYQGAGRKIGVEEVKKLNSFATENIKPDITFYIDIPVSTFYQRKLFADRIECEGTAFLETVRQAYLKMAREEPNRIVVIDGSKNTEDVWKSILSHLNQVRDLI